MTFDDLVYGMTTIINVYVGEYASQGSGFFYNVLSEKDPSQKTQWRNVLETWLVTNRHVALPFINEHEMCPDIFTFNLRYTLDGVVQWIPIILSKEDFKQRLKLHNNPSVDVALIEIGDILKEKFKEKYALMNFGGVSNDNLPINSKLRINVGDDILVVGYPRGFYDKVNMFPIVKSGIISSKWGCYFNGNPLFLIDSKLFPGSSGSVVLTKPKHIAVVDEQIMYNNAGEYIFLGIYSGEPVRRESPIELEGLTIIKTESYNLGNVWYSSLVPEIISNGVKIE